MIKKLMCFSILLVVLICALSVCAYAQCSYSNGTDVYKNGDTEFYSNIDDEDKLYKLTLPEMTEEKIFEEHIISMVGDEDTLYLLTYHDGASRIIEFDTKTYFAVVLKEFNSLVTDIAKRDNMIYYTENKNVYCFNIDTFETTVLIETNDVALFYFADYHLLKCYAKTQDDSYIRNTYIFSPEGAVSLIEDDVVKLMSASNYKPRLKDDAPAVDNPYYTTKNPFHTSLNKDRDDNYGMINLKGEKRGNCTCYAYGRAYENLGTKPKLCLKDAENWYSYNKDGNYYPYSSYVLEPALGAIVVWGKGVVGNDKDGAGHVAVVEVIDGNEVITSESGWEKFYYKTRERSLKNSNLDQATPYSFLGYIYVCEQPNPHTHSKEVYEFQEDAHPHCNCYRCSVCGEIWRDTSSFNFWSSCGECQAHTHDKGEYQFQEDFHPHYDCYRCTVCGEIWRDTSSPNFFGSCGECQAHTHDKGEYQFQEAFHPHYDCYRCTVCGEIWIDYASPNYWGSCGECQAHTHDKGEYQFQEAFHPHYNCYKCSFCGEIWIDYASSNFWDSCNECVQSVMPGKPALQAMAPEYWHKDSISFVWDETAFTTHYNLYIQNADGTKYETVFYAESGLSRQLPAGEYKVLLQSTNANYWTEDGASWIYTNADWVYFVVAEEKTADTFSTVHADGNMLTIYTELYDFTEPCEVIVAGYKDKRFVATASVASGDSKERLTHLLYGDVDEIKVIVLDSWEKLNPLCAAEVIMSGEFIAE